VKIAPDQPISTVNDDIQLGDGIKFKVTQDIIYDGKLYLKKDSHVVGIVDYVSDNGWSFDNAEIKFKTFKTRDINNNLVIITSPFTIDGFDILKYKGNRKAQFFNYLGIAARGKEIEIIPGVDDLRFTIWLEK
jgi:hypothetical protein